MRIFECESCGRKRTMEVDTISSCSCPQCGRLMFPLKAKEASSSVPFNEVLEGLLENLESSSKRWKGEGYYGCEQKAYVTGRIDELKEIIDMVKIKIKTAD